MATCRQWLETLPPPKGILKSTQNHARQVLSQIGLPTKNLEPWRLTDLKRIEKDESIPPSSRLIVKCFSTIDAPCEIAAIAAPIPIV